MNVWLLLGVTIAVEITATSLLKASDGFTKPWLGAGSILLYSACFWLLALIFTRLPMGVVYAIWSGVGIAGIALVGWLIFRQPLTPLQLAFMALIIVGAVGLNLSTRSGAM